MEGQQPLSAELQAALQKYEIAMRDGGQAEQEQSYEALRQVQQREREIGGAAVVAFFSTENQKPLEAPD